MVVPTSPCQNCLLFFNSLTERKRTKYNSAWLGPTGEFYPNHTTIKITRVVKRPLGIGFGGG